MKRRRNKYGAEETWVHGRRFASRREARRYCELLLLQQAGEIADLECQVPILLEGKDGPLVTRSGRRMRLTVDFSYTDRETGATVYEDAKGKPTRDYEVRRAVAAAQGIKIREV